MKDLNDIAVQVKNTENSMNNLIVPLLKDTIEDSNRHNKRLFTLCVILAISAVIISLFSQVLVAVQNQKYAEFLSQFEFETETVYQDLNANDGGNAIIHDGINITK